MARVLLVNMPFSSVRWPNLGLGLLKAALARRGIDCDVAYLNFDLAERLGWDDYCWIADIFGFVLGGERLFAKHYFENLPSDEAYYREVIQKADARFDDADRREFEAIERHVEPFLEHCRTAVDWSQYDVVGFTSSFQQTMPSLCLARWLKQTQPNVKILFGGAACEAEMGIELHASFPEIDHVFLGEADASFPRVVEDLLAGRPPAESAIEPVDLDELPYPDFDDYFSRLAQSPLAEHFEPTLFFEASRGCWWGEKTHCLFCGLNGSRLAFRSKRPDRVIAELRYLADRHAVRRFSTADNILDHRYLQTLFPRLAESPIGVEFIFEMKTSLRREQADLLLKAGLGGAQLGIETFSTPLLRRIGKGATAVQNLQTLKWFSEAGIEVKWNFLYGFPGEEPAEYETLAKLVPLLRHLAPPLGVGSVRADRFSPYFENPAAHGIVNLRPHSAFRFVFPFSEESLARLAYYSEYDYADGRDPASYAAPLLAELERWQHSTGRESLRYWDRPDGTLIVTDTRDVATAFQHRLTRLDREVFLYCDTGRAFPELLQHFHGSADETAVRQSLARLIADRLMVCLDERYVTLALRTHDSDSGTIALD